MVVAECDRDCISIISCSGEKESFGSLGLGPDHFHSPNGVAIDKGGNILVADTGITIFSSCQSLLSSRKNENTNSFLRLLKNCFSDNSY